MKLKLGEGEREQARQRHAPQTLPLHHNELVGTPSSQLSSNTDLKKQHPDAIGVLYGSLSGAYGEGIYAT